MNRKNCKESRLGNPNWLDKIMLPDINRIYYNIKECFLSFGDKIVDFEDKKLMDGDKCVSYSCNVK